MDGRLEGKVAVVTGGASGIGLCTVERFVAEGAYVVFCDLPNDRTDSAEVPEREGGHAVANRLGDRARFVAADVSSYEQLHSVIERAIDGFGRLDIMFNNAGISPLEGSLLDVPDDVFDHVIDVNLRAVWRGIRIAGRCMAEAGGGSIISTSSLAALDGYPGLSAYTAAKAGVVGLTRAASVELGGANVRVNCICPGAIVTPLNVQRNGAPEAMVRVRSRELQPIPRPGYPSDVAGTVVWLASDDAAFVTGQVIAVDGGVAAEAAGPIRRRLAESMESAQQ